MVDGRYREGAVNDARLANEWCSELRQKVVQLRPRVRCQLWLLQMSDLGPGHRRDFLRVDFEGFDREFRQRRRQATELEDDAAHVERTCNEVLVVDRADVEPASTHVEVRRDRYGIDEGTQQQIVVETYTIAGRDARHFHYLPAYLAGQSAQYTDETYRRANHRQTM